MSVPPQLPDPETAARDEASRYGFFALLRHLERERKDAPRIGTNRTLREEFVRIGQDASLAFPISDLSRVERDPEGHWHLQSNVLGLFGPQGPLPLNLTEEAMRWSLSGDPSYIAFADIFASRFFQLYFRAWSDSHGISQHDRPEDDRFAQWLGAFIGSGTAAFRGRDGIAESNRAYLGPIGHGRIKSPVRLRQILETGLGDRFEVHEHQVSWIEIEPNDRCALGRQGSSLSRDMFLGGRICTVNDHITIDIEVPSLARYRDYLPEGAAHRRLCDLIYWYLHDRISVTVNLSLPASQIPAARLGQSAELGWMAALPRKAAANMDAPVKVSGFQLVLSPPPAPPAAKRKTKSKPSAKKVRA